MWDFCDIGVCCVCLSDPVVCAPESCQIRAQQALETPIIKKPRSISDVKKSALTQDTLNMDARRDEMSRRPMYCMCA